ncbi:helix-turn-helix transcriptional regulator [uncultured Brevundimonas sp.]|uniref:helix-turn-helix domain-containing protein n=1 Tax=uncultured Brevundimonas sp. TaxID=213418 RepID=UPI0030EDCA23|tara:strand:+ start:6060 stop:6650 length:591 start_codon:yes stop_codon:yes gene_type:complete
MPRFELDPAARRLGEALATLRRDRGLSQAEAGARMGMTSQGWGLYEAGRRPGLFRPDVQRRLTAAIDATVEDLERQCVVQPLPEPEPSGLEARPRAFSRSADTETAALPRLQLSNDDLRPWAASGVVLVYEPGRWPRRDQGCVIHMNDGETRIRLYDRADAEALVVHGGPSGLGVEERIPRSTVREVAAVVARLEH